MPDVVHPFEVFSQLTFELAKIDLHGATTQALSAIVASPFSLPPLGATSWREGGEVNSGNTVGYICQWSRLRRPSIDHR